MSAQQLTRRELEVLKLTALGHRMKSIASMLHIAEKTVNGYRRKILRATGARNAIEATRWAIAHGVVPVPTPENWR